MDSDGLLHICSSLPCSSTLCVIGSSQDFESDGEEDFKGLGACRGFLCLRTYIICNINIKVLL
jgi:hypothetical protein